VDTVAKLNAALEAAFLTMGIDPEEARFRLRDIIVEEVSLVDRAANRRRFLVVKNVNGGEAMGGTAKKAAADDQQLQQGDALESNPDDQGSSEDASAEVTEKISLPKAVKEGLMRILTESLERLVSLSNAVKEADETEEELEEPVPEATGKELLKISDLLRGALSKYPSPVSMSDVNKMDSPREAAHRILWAVERQINDGALDDPQDKTTAEALLNLLKEHVMPRGEADMAAKAEGEISQTLMSVAEMAGELAKTAASEDELSAELIANVRKLAAKLNGLAEQYPEPVAGANRADAAKNEEGEMGAANAEPANKVADQLTAIADTITRVAESPSQEDLASIATQLRDVAKAMEPGTEDQPAGEGAGDSDATGGEGETNSEAANEAKNKEGEAQAAESEKSEGDAPTEPSLGDLIQTLSTLVGKLMEQQSTEKRAAENHLQPPDRVDGDMGNIGQGPKDDEANVNAEGNPLSDVMKRLDTLGEQVKKIAETPQVPASRGGEPVRKNGSNSDGRSRRGGPWAM
jgi:hypothetical protein